MKIVIEAAITNSLALVTQDDSDGEMVVESFVEAGITVKVVDADLASFQIRGKTHVDAPEQIIAAGSDFTTPKQPVYWSKKSDGSDNFDPATLTDGESSVFLVNVSGMYSISIWAEGSGDGTLSVWATAN